MPSQLLTKQPKVLAFYPEWNIKWHIARGCEWPTRNTGQLLSPVTSTASWSPWRMGSPVWFQEHLGAVTDTALTGTWGAVMPLPMQVPGCSELAALSCLTLLIWQTFRWMLFSPSQLMAKTCKASLLLSMPYQALTLSCHKVTAETIVFILWKCSALLIFGCRAEDFQNAGTAIIELNYHIAKKTKTLKHCGTAILKYLIKILFRIWIRLEQNPVQIPVLTALMYHMKLGRSASDFSCFSSQYPTYVT